MLATAMRAQDFLASKLPPPQVDKFSLTPHLEPQDIPDSAKADFMAYVRVIMDPVSVLKDIGNGQVNDQQVEALQAVYPQMYGQMKTEIQHQLATMKQPLDYERSTHVGTLLGIVTDEVLDKSFQSALAARYAQKKADGEQGPGGSKTPSSDSQVVKSVMSTSQQVERGDM
jgi:hypothetical protein